MTCAHVRPSRIACTAPLDRPSREATAPIDKPSAKSLRATLTLSSVNFDLPFASPKTALIRPASCWKRVFSASVQYRKLSSRLSALVTVYMVDRQVRWANECKCDQAMHEPPLRCVDAPQIHHEIPARQGRWNVSLGQINEANAVPNSARQSAHPAHVADGIFALVSRHIFPSFFHNEQHILCINDVQWPRRSQGPSGEG